MKVEIRTPFPDTFVRSSLKTDKMKTIPLTKGKVALVDDGDYDYLMQWKWCDTHGYAMRRSYEKGTRKRKTILMHRVIMNTPVGLEVDHKDFNGLNNQKYNLRNCTSDENRRYRRGKGVSKYMGVSLHTQVKVGKKSTYFYQKWIAYIRVGSKYIYLGVHEKEEDAARAYDDAARKYNITFANLNFK